MRCSCLSCAHKVQNVLARCGALFQERAGESSILDPFVGLQHAKLTRARSLGEASWPTGLLPGVDCGIALRYELIKVAECLGPTGVNTGRSRFCFFGNGCALC